jgi:multidrug efflux pump subunit AcrA (membrane-fusion protein)
MNSNWRIFFGLCAFIGLGACAGSSSASGIPEQNVEAATVGERLITDDISGFGVLSFLTKVDITAPQDGVIARLNCREGDLVREGDTVLVLDNPQITLAAGKARIAHTQAEAAVRLASARLLEGRFGAEAEILGIERVQAELTQARRVFAEEQRKQENEEKLFEAGGISGENILSSRFNLAAAAEQITIMEQDLEIRTIGLRDKDLASAGLLPSGGFPDGPSRTGAQVHLAVSTLRAELEAAEAQLEGAAKELESVLLAQSELVLRSPASGIVGARYLEIGERAARGDKILTLMETESLYAIVSLREAEALRLQKGMSARVDIDGSGGTYEGTVDLVLPQADSQSFTFSVRILLSGSEIRELKPGMFARALIHAGPGRKCIAVPGVAITGRKGEEGSVFVISGGRVSERKVALGSELDGGEQEILSGLATGEVIAARSGSLREGTPVRIIKGTLTS